MVIYRDISSRIELIEQFIYPINKFEDYMADLKTQSSIVKEALDKLKT